MGKWKKSSQELIDQFYTIMECFPKAELRKMFGYPCAFFNGNMFIGLHEDNVIVRLDQKERDDALEKCMGTVFAPMKGRVMREYISLSHEIVQSEKKFKEMVSKSFSYVESLPEKIKK